MNEQNRIISRNLKALLEKKGISQKEAADALGVTPQSFNAWVNGIAAPRMGKVQLLADFFNVPKSAIIEAQPAEVIEAFDAVEIIANAFEQTGYYNTRFTKEEIEDIMKYASFVLMKRATK